MEGSDTYNHSKDVRPIRDASKQCPFSTMHTAVMASVSATWG